MNSLDSCYNIADLRVRAKHKLPAPMFHYIDGGADDEWTLLRNSQAFSDYQIIPNHLRNIESIDLRTDILGTTLDLPFFWHPLECPGFSITTKNLLLAVRRTRREPYTVCRPLQHPA
jgi:isopentenyl diphosphate isomerase/L-lactate dehydrogenase-like FMN-dependent dehydrogenase